MKINEYRFFSNSFCIQNLFGKPMYEALFPTDSITLVKVSHLH